MTFKINDGDKTVSTDIEVGRNIAKSKVRLHMHYADPKHDHLRVTAILEPYAAHQVADALIREHNDLTGGKLRIINKDSPAFLVEMYGGSPNILGTAVKMSGRLPPEGTVHDDARRAKPGDRIPGLGGAVKTWEHSYTKQVFDRISIKPGDMMIRATWIESVRAARDLLLDYWKSMHKIYEDRDQARAELAVVREMHRGVVAKMRREIDRETKLRVDSDRQLRETNSKLFAELRKLKDSYKIINDALTYERTSHIDTRKSLSVARDELNKAADKRRDLEREITELKKPTFGQIRIEARRCACKAMLLPTHEGLLVKSGDSRKSTNSWHSWSACTVKA